MRQDERLTRKVSSIAIVLAACIAASAQASGMPLQHRDAGSLRLLQDVQYRYGSRILSYDELAYQCSLGSQTPYSLRSTCARLGLGIGAFGRSRGREDYGFYRGRRLSFNELAFQCSLGSETPYSLRSTCRRYGIGGW
jgi:hypothetical protein